MERLPKEQPNIAFAGLTAAGKTTHAKILAEQLGYRYVSATQTILDILGMNDNPDRVWLTSYDKIEKAREGDHVDIELEARMTDMANKSGALVLDTWAMAWVYDGSTPMVRLWMESDEDSRTRKCYVSQGEEKPYDLDDCRTRINQKDSDTREKFQRRLGFDLFNDRSKYDIILNNTALIPEATDQAAQAGIARFAPVVLAATRYCMDRVLIPDFDLDGAAARELMESSDGMITKLGNTALADL
jgi:cytidylate kinase